MSLIFPIRYCLTFILLIILSTFAEAGSSYSTKSLSIMEDSEKLRFEVISKLIDNGSVSLKGKHGCESLVQFKQDTVGRFVAWSLSFYSQEQANSIKVMCEKQKNDEICSVYFYADSKGESPWACGLRFLYKSKKKKIQSSSIECIGTC